MRAVSSLRIDADFALISLGLGASLLWCTLAGHTGGFPSFLLDLGPSINPRLFFLSGLLATSTALAAAPHWCNQHARPLSLALPIASSAGTAAFALAPSQSMIDPAALSIVGLVAFGIGYLWIVSHLYLRIQQTSPSLPRAVWIITAGLAVEALALPFVRLMPSDAVNAIAVVLPLALSALLLLGQDARQTAKKPLSTTSTLQKLPTDRKSRGRIAILSVSAAVLLATVRSFSSMGLWGSNPANQNFPTEASFALASSALLAVFAYSALVKTASWRFELRFQPAFILVLGGLFTIASQLPNQTDPPPFFDALMRLDDSCAHLLFWIVALAAASMIDATPLRVIGAAAAIYSISSIAWVALIGSEGAFVGMAMTVITYLLTISTVFGEWANIRKANGTARSAKEEPESVGSASAEQTPAFSNNDISGGGVSQAIASRCKEIAEDKRLSPRETEIFILLAQGRTRTFVQEHLVLAENTVKTHVSHIYAKLEVSNRQEMMDLVLNDGGKPLF